MIPDAASRQVADPATMGSSSMIQLSILRMAAACSSASHARKYRRAPDGSRCTRCGTVIRVGPGRTAPVRARTCRRSVCRACAPACPNGCSRRGWCRAGSRCRPPSTHVFLVEQHGDLAFQHDGVVHRSVRCMNGWRWFSRRSMPTSLPPELEEFAHLLRRQAAEGLGLRRNLGDAYLGARWRERSPAGPGSDRLRRRRSGPAWRSFSRYPWTCGRPGWGDS